MSVKYELLKKAFRIIPVQKMMAKPYDDLMKLFKTAKAKPNIPVLSDPDFEIETITVDSSPVLMIRHRKPSDSLCVYLVGGGIQAIPGKRSPPSRERDRKRFCAALFPFVPG